MRIFVSGATATFRKLLPQFRGMLGRLVTPQNGNSLHNLVRDNVPWACDNAAFSNPCDDKFRRMVWECWDLLRFNPPEWISVPDVVGDHLATRLNFDLWIADWEYEFGFIEWPLAFVLQNGCTEADVPWDLIDGVFVGGCTEWKLRGSLDLVQAARDRGKWVHVGRVCSRRRLQWAVDVGADSIDSSAFSRFPEARLVQALKWLQAIKQQPTLFEVA